MEHKTWQSVQFHYPTAVPSMISAEERQYLYWLGRSVWSGKGAVIEIGPWLGGSTLCLATGMRASGHEARKRLNVFDNFIWREFMSVRSPLPIQPGESFESYFLTNVQDYQDIIEHHVQALQDEIIRGDHEAEQKRFSEVNRIPIFEWPSHDPVEVLFIDGAKSWRGMRQLLKTLCDRLITGSSYIVCQDYKYWEIYWVPVMMTRLATYLEPVHNVLKGTTVTFRVIAEIPRRVLDNFEDDVAALPTDQTLRELNRASSMLADDGDTLGSINVLLSKTKFLSHQGNINAAVEEFMNIQESWPIFFNTAQLERAREYLRTEKRRPIPRSKGLQWAFISKNALNEFKKRISKFTKQLR